MRFDWSKLGRTPPAALAGARVLAHHAAQWPTRAARANLKAAPDDSHSAFTWEASHAALLTQGLHAKGGDVRTGVRIPRLELIITRGDNVLDAFQLGGKTDAQAGAWLDSKLRILGLNLARDVDLPYELPPHPAAGGPHDLHMLGRELGELARWFGGAADALHEFVSRLAGPRAGPVLCWPHHFDIATLVSLENGANARTIGVGVSPGDEYYTQPYVYISPWPRFDGEKLPAAPSPGHWHTEGFFGAVATGDDILAMGDRGRGLMAFINAAFDISRARLEALKQP
ncbi:MAG TPA: hypothetical protein VEH51_13040 [Burkholderiales bacterium]|nr:hypothetical protein [Burkholderiales bacterium]